MKIIDFEHKGQSVRFYLGEDYLEDWWGDDWDDAPYEYNAGMVYDEYIAAHKDITFNFDDCVLEPKQDWRNKFGTEFCKNDMKNRAVPCIIVVPAEVYKDNSQYEDSFSHWVGDDRVKKYYFGDTMEP